MTKAKELEEAQQRAALLPAAQALCLRLGAGWTPNIYPMGRDYGWAWRYSADLGDRLSVRPEPERKGSERHWQPFRAYLRRSDKLDDLGWEGFGETPDDAVVAVLKVAQDEINQLTADLAEVRYAVGESIRATIRAATTHQPELA